VSDPKDHHFLPVFLLKRWAAAGAGGELVRYYRPRREVRARNASPTAAAKVTGLYALQGYPPEMRNIIEREFMGPVVDDPAARALEAMLAAPAGGVLPVELRIGWARFIVSLWFRTPAALENVLAESASALRAALESNPEEYEAAQGENDPATFVEFVETRLPATFTDMGLNILPELIAHEGFVRDVARMNWRIVPFPQPAEDLLIGDVPIFRSDGLASPRCLIALQVSPRHLFVAAYDPDRHVQLLAPGPEFMAQSHNEWHAASARREVFGATRDHLVLVEKHLRPLAA
jgi:hypothetical protein